MSEITTIGLDLAKHVFQVHGIDAESTTVLRFSWFVALFVPAILAACTSALENPVTVFADSNFWQTFDALTHV
jgi:hypothetical protein